MANSKNIGTLIETLNAKAAAAGEDIRAVHVTIDATWGDNCGVAILGTGDRERAARFVQAYSREPAFTGRVISLVYYPCAD